jgi:TetR/AcrR family transcriptional regulator, regulator of cefoperazone and chloramphenicol sensitivity
VTNLYHPPHPLGTDVGNREAVVAPAVGTSAKAQQTCASERLLRAALQLFAEKGFANTSIRDLAQKAQVNVAAISYYFKDKVGLYSAAFSENLRCGERELLPFGMLPSSLGEPLREELSGLMKSFIEPLKCGDLAAWRVRIHMREMLESSGLWAREIECEIAPALRALEARLCQELGILAPNERVQRLAFSITGMGVHMLVAREVVQAVHPALLANESAIDVYIDQLVDYAMAMVEVEKKRMRDEAGT